MSNHPTEADHNSELRIRPAQKRIGDVMGTLKRFSSDFMAHGREEQVQSERKAL